MNIRDYLGQRVHMIGIGGSSMSGLAEMLFSSGYQITGSDASPSHHVENLRMLGIPITVGHHPEIINGAALILYSAAIAEDDPERVAARELGIPQMERATLLGQLMQGYHERLCICGTHGKTTTSAMVAQMLVDMGLNPTVHIGGELDALGGSSRRGGSELFVAEACEYNRSFHQMPPSAVALLNIEEDHLEYYHTMDEVEEAYRVFLDMLPEDGPMFVNFEDERSMRVAAKVDRPLITYGLHRGDWTVRDIRVDESGNPTFTALLRGEPMGQISLRVQGAYNILHALTAYAYAHHIGGDLDLAREALSHFTGAHRRFEKTGVINGMHMYHDYGHNPAEMQYAISVAKLQNRRVIAVMQPHTYSRPINLFNDYLKCTQQADVTLVTDIYAAREKDPGTIHAAMLVDGMLKNGIMAVYTPTFDDCEQWLLQNGRAGDLVLTMGCGNINLLNEQMQKNWDASHQTEDQ